MKRLLTTSCTNTSFNIATLVLRLIFGSLIFINHGLDKLQHFGKLQKAFPDPFHLGSMPSLMLMIFAEAFCSIFIVLGLFTRLAVIPLIIAFLVVIFVVKKNTPITGLELPLIYLGAFTTLLLTGSGKYSLDGALGK